MTQRLISKHIKYSILALSLLASLSFYSQANSFQPELLKPDPEKEAKFLPYLALRHGGMANIEEWKSKNTYKYYQELWYYSESFYIKRNQHTEGIRMDESQIDISRFELSRKENEESIIELPGFKDVLVLLPKSKLIYTPQQ